MNPSISRCGIFLRVVSAALMAAPLVAQCELQWQPGQLPGADAEVFAALAWDPDGPGPLGPVVVFGGAFRAIGTMPAHGVAIFDPVSQQWSSPGAGVDGEVRALAVLPGGDLVLAGNFQVAGGVPAAGLAAYDGVAFRALGGGISGGSDPVVTALAVAADGSLVLGGNFQQAGGVPAANLARFAGGSYAAIGGGVQGEVAAVACLPDGSVVVGGKLLQAGSLPPASIARYDGTAWSSMAGGMALQNVTPSVDSLLVLPDGRLLAGGTFSHAGGNPVGSIAVWNGSGWSAMDGGLAAPVRALALDGTGAVLASSSVVQGRVVMRWNGASWETQGPLANQPIACIAALAGGELYVGGGFTAYAGSPAYGLLRRQGGQWAPMVAATLPFPLPPSHLLATAGGGLFALRLPASPGGVQIARWDGLEWNSLTVGSLALVSNPSVVLLGAEDLVVTGSLLSAAYQRWTAGVWSALQGPPVQGTPLVAASDGAGGLYSVHGNQLWHWDRVRWLSVATGLGSGVRQLVTLPTGEVVVAGTFASVGGVAAANIARFAGGQWTALGAGTNGPVTGLAVLTHGDLVVCGDFTQAGGVPASHVARWDGSSWSAFGTGMRPTQIASLPNGELLAAGELLVQGVPTPGQLARGNGSGWLRIPGLNGAAAAVSASSDGWAAVGGSFTNAGGGGALQVAMLRSGCPATAVAYGAGCAGSAGTVALQAKSLPWLGGRMATEASMLAPSALAFGVLGFVADATPLSQWHPAGGPGCQALVVPVATQWLPVAGGRAAWQQGVPQSPALVGVRLLQQVLQAEFGGGGQLVLLSSSAGLELRIGAL